MPDIQTATHAPIDTDGLPLNSQPFPTGNQLALAIGGAAGAGGATSLPAAVGYLTYLTGLHFLMVKTAAATGIGNINITNINNDIVLPFAGDGTRIFQLDIEWPTPIPATGPNTPITATVGALTGGGAWSLTVEGFVA